MQTKRKTLLDISDELLAFEELLTDVEGDITDIEEQIDAWLLSIEEQIVDKLDGYGQLYAELMGRAEFRQAEADRMAALAKVDKNAAEKLKQRVQIFFQVHKYTKLETARHRFTLCKNGGKQPLEVDYEDPKELPDEYRITVTSYKQDSDKLRQDLEAGKEIKFARMLPRGTHLRIK